jgi:predicted component of type VI protein secretion system
MALYLHIMTGEGFGAKFPLTAGLKIGRSRGEVRVQDSKMSALHAEVQIHPLGGFCLVDSGSSHGILVGHQRIRELRLESGVRFCLGKTEFEILELGLDQPGLENEGAWPDPFDPSTRSQLLKHLALIGKTKWGKIDAVPFSEPLQLKFIEGLEYGRSLTLGYGPRGFGATELDFELLEPGCPNYAFCIEPLDQGARLINNSEKPVIVNGLALPDKKLSHGDEIRIGETLIKVLFEKF